MPISRFGLVEGQTVADIVLDTGCFRTMVHKNLVDKTKYLEGEAVTIRCIIQTAPDSCGSSVAYISVAGNGCCCRKTQVSDIQLAWKQCMWCEHVVRPDRRKPKML